MKANSPVHPISLKAIFKELPLAFSPAAPPDVPISGIEMDSRNVESGNLFVAVRGGKVDGHLFIPEAVRRGARAVVGEVPLVELDVPYIQVENSRQALAYLAAAFHGWPGRKLTMIGVTGTDGKTTTCNLLFQILLASGIRAGLISTVNAVIGDQVLDTGFHVTTPGAPDIQSYLARMVQAGLTHVILETTSHGWAQYRTDACEFDIGVITNITHEHLDEHGSFENYRAVKARLFQVLGDTHPKPIGNPRLAVLNRDDASCEYLEMVIRASVHSVLAPVQVLHYGLDASADIRAVDVSFDPGGTRFTALMKDLRIPIRSRLVGYFNVSNCLAALAASVHGLGVEGKAAARGIAALDGVPGRMERIDLGQPFTAIVDFAHTPQALRAAIETVRQFTTGRVIVIFGSAGLRDRQKRPMMAEISAELADVTILTAEDPRTESLEEILDEMSDGARSKGGVEGQTYFCVPDRGEAIRLGVRLAQEGDAVMSCGKGHEQSMCFGTVEYPWDDRIAMRAAVAEMLGIEGPEWQQLPTRGEK